MGDEMFSIEVNKNFDVISQRWETKIFLKLYLSMFKDGLVRELGSERLAVLLAIASHMDEDGRCYPTQEQIAEILGISRTTANKRINSLLEFRWKDRPVIERQKLRNPKVSPNEFSVYTILPLSQLAIFHGEIEDPAAAAPEDPKPKSGGAARELVSYFAEKYRETYAANFAVSWGRDMGHAKKILAAYPDHWQEILDTVFLEYEERWATRDYPRPSLGQVGSWLGARAAEITAERREQMERFELQQPDPNDTERLLQRLRGELL